MQVHNVFRIFPLYTYIIIYNNLLLNKLKHMGVNTVQSHYSHPHILQWIILFTFVFNVCYKFKGKTILNAIEFMFWVTSFYF